MTVPAAEPGGATAVARLVRATVRTCAASPWRTLLVCLLLCGALGLHAARTLTLVTDTNVLFDDDLPFRKADEALKTLFPGEAESIVVAVEAPGIGSAQDAAARLAARLRQTPQLYTAVREPQGGAFFARNGLLYLDTAQLEDLSMQLAQAQPLLGALSADPGAAGFFSLVERGLQAVAQGEAMAAQLAPALDQAAASLESLEQGRPRPLDWNSLIGGDLGEGAARALVLVVPARDTAQVVSGAQASTGIRAAARTLNLTPDHGFRVRLTGATPLEDEEFASVAAGTETAGLVSVTLVLLLLLIAVRSPRYVGAILITLAAGGIATAGWAALSVGRLNIISIAFAVMFVGIAVDFGIQFCLRTRDQRLHAADNATALDRAASQIAGALLLAALATAAGFFSFLPTDYRGVAELGVIAGGSMVIAFIVTITLLPALIVLFNPGGENEPPGYAWAAPVNHWLLRHRRAVLLAAGAGTALCLLMLPRLAFDFDPLKLKDPTTESMATLLDLMGDPWTTPNTLTVLAPDIGSANATAARLRALPAVRAALTLSDFVPAEQDTRLAILQDLSFLMGTALDDAGPPPAADAARTIAAARALARSLDRFQPPADTPPALLSAIRRLHRALDVLIRRLDSPQGPRVAADAQALLTGGFPAARARLATALQATPVTLADLPRDITATWIATDGRYRIQVYPAGDQRDLGLLQTFLGAVRGVSADVSGTPVTVIETGKVVIGAFARAAVLALLAVAVLLLFTLRRAGDVARTLAPLALASVWTLGTAAALHLPITFANIIGLPLLLGIGVTYPIYFVTAWRAGDDRLLSSAMARAVLFSALTTAAAFGSLALSSHPGTAGLGILLTLALGYAMLATFVVLPALLGPAHR